jgi:hypothetical protein
MTQTNTTNHYGDSEAYPWGVVLIDGGDGMDYTP